MAAEAFPLTHRVRVKLGNRIFSPHWLAVLLYLIVATIMVQLGRWQLDRAAEKIALLESAELARELPAVRLEAVADVVADAAAYRQVELAGIWLSERQLLWDNRAHQGRAGYEVILPVRLSDGRLALVNRGWVAPGATREDLPDVTVPVVTSESDPPVVLSGLLSRPSKGYASGAALAQTGPWPRVLQFFDYAAIEAALGEPIVPAVVQLQVAEESVRAANLQAVVEADKAPATTATSIETPRRATETLTDAALLTPNWRPASSGPQKHYGYAFQWFAMAAALTVIFVVVNLSRKESNEPEQPATPV